MLAPSRLPRDLRRVLPLALLAGCMILSLLYVRSLQPNQPGVAELYHRRKVGSIEERKVDSIEERHGSNSGERAPAGDPATKAPLDTDSLAPEVKPEVAASGGAVHVSLQQTPVRRPWEGVDGCSQYGIRFAERSTLPIVALSSYPGSGNTWTRYMLELASGVFSGSIYYDMGLYSIGYWGELSSPEEGTTIVQKVHDFGEDQVKRFNRTAIVIVRNPYRAVLSFHNYLFGGHKGMAPSANYLKKGWRTFVMKQVFEWSAHVQKWTEPGNKVLVVHYEHLKSDPVGQLRRMLHFLNWPVDEDRLRCVQEDVHGVARRPPAHFPADVEPFPADVRAVVQHGVSYVDQLLRQRGHPPLPLDRYSRSSGERLEECYAEEDFPSCLARVDAMNPSAPAAGLLARATALFSRLLGDPLQVDLRSGLGATSGPPKMADVPQAATLSADWRLFQMSRQEL